LIKSIDPRHLVESGLLGGNQCGITATDYVLAQNTPNIDVVSYHNYGDSSPVPAGLTQRIQQAQQLNKPIIVGEVGFLTDCTTMQAKQSAQFAAGVSGFLPWNWNSTGDTTCGF
jgi:mannan endo-1,4-beta-mannosidase